MERENWIEDVLNSTDAMTKALPHDRLFSKIQARIKKENTVSSKWLWAAAASLTILIALNVKVVFAKSKTQKSATERIASELTNSNQLY